MLKSRDIEGEIEEQVKNSTNYSELEDELGACYQFLTNIHYHETSLAEYNKTFERYSELMAELNK